jgi:hypothetical protein
LWLPDLSSGRVSDDSDLVFSWAVLLATFRVSGGPYHLRVSAVEEEASVFELHTSGEGFHCLDLSLRRVWQHQEVYIFRRAEPLVSSVFSRPYQQSSGSYQLLEG